jgi:membrane protease YdiL (CAAX protease family)
MRLSEPDIRAPIIAIMLMQVAALFVRAFLEIRLAESGESRLYAQDISYLVVPPILIVLMYPILRQHWHVLRALLRTQDVSLRLIALSVLLGFSLRASFWGGLVSLGSFGVLRNPDSDAVVGPVIFFGCPEPTVLILSFLVVSFLIPVTEEIINRGLILQTLLHRGRVLAVVVSSALFAVMHDPQAILVAFVIGLFLAVMMNNYKTLYAPMIAHATYNAIAVLDWECISGKWNPVETTTVLIGIGLIGSALAVTGISLSMFLVTRKNIEARKRPDADTC